MGIAEKKRKKGVASQHLTFRKIGESKLFVLPYRVSIDKAEGKVCYQYGKDSSELERMDYLSAVPTAQVDADRTIISFIEDHKVIDKIINHLKLTFHTERPPPSQVVQQELLMAAEEREEYF